MLLCSILLKHFRKRMNKQSGNCLALNRGGHNRCTMHGEGCCTSALLHVTHDTTEGCGPFFSRAPQVEKLYASHPKLILGNVEPQPDRQTHVQIRHAKTKTQKKKHKKKREIPTIWVKEPQPFRDIFSASLSSNASRVSCISI